VCGGIDHTSLATGGTEPAVLAGKGHQQLVPGGTCLLVVKRSSLFLLYHGGDSIKSMADQPSTYSGDAPYVFVCYSHEDSKAVYRQLGALQGQGLRLWYDQGISPGTRWSDELASALSGASLVFFFCTENAVQSPHCQDEVAFALEEGIPIVVIRPEALTLPPGLRLRLGAQQALITDNLTTDGITASLLKLAAAAISDVKADQTTDQTTRVSDKRFPIGRVAGLLIALLTIVGIGYWAATQSEAPEPVTSQQASASNDQTQTRQSNTNPTPPTIVIMPLRVIGEESQTKTLAVGLEEEIAATLVGPELETVRNKDIQTAQGLDVTPSHAVPTTLTTPADVLTSLDSEYVVSGSVQIADESARITLQLTFAGEERVTWTQTYRYPADDLLKLQTDVALHCASSVIQEIALRRYAWEVKPYLPPGAWLPFLSARKLQYKQEAGDYVPPEEILSHWQTYYDLTGDVFQIAPAYQQVYLSQIQPAAKVTDFEALSDTLEPLANRTRGHVFWPRFARILQAVNALIMLNPDQYHRLMQQVPDDALLRDMAVLYYAIYSGDFKLLRDAAEGLQNTLAYLDALIGLGQYQLGLAAVPDALLVTVGSHGRARVKSRQAIMLRMMGQEEEAREILEAAFHTYGAGHPDAFPAAFALTGQAERARALMESLERTGFIERMSLAEKIEAHLHLSNPETVFRMMDQAIEARHFMAMGLFKLMDQADLPSSSASATMRETMSMPAWRQRMDLIYALTPTETK
jgi:TolB-like protein